MRVYRPAFRAMRVPATSVRTTVGNSRTETATLVATE